MLLAVMLCAPSFAFADEDKTYFSRLNKQETEDDLLEIADPPSLRRPINRRTIHGFGDIRHIAPVLIAIENRKC